MRKLMIILSMVAAIGLISGTALACPGNPNCNCDKAAKAEKAKDAKAAGKDCGCGGHKKGKAHAKDCNCSDCQKAKADAKAKGGAKAKGDDPGCGGCPHAGSHPDCPHAKGKKK